MMLSQAARVSFEALSTSQPMQGNSHYIVSENPPTPSLNTMFRDLVNIPLHFVGQASHEHSQKP